MAVAVNKTAFVTGEASPKLFGHVDLARFQSAASTMRNMWVGFEGGAYSRGGTAFVDFSKQTGRAYPPRMIPFQFSINQGIALEFGDFYMRVVVNGAFVTENAAAISAITRASPAVVTASAEGALSAVPIDGGVTASYAPGDTVTIAGGTFTSPAVFTVGDTILLSAQADNPGSGYVPADTITLDGGTQVTAPVATVTTTQVASATITSGGSGGTNGAAVVTGATGVGVKFSANVTIAGGTITSVDSIEFGGAYTTNPTTLNAEPVVGGGLSGAELDVVMGVGSVNITTPGLFSANAPGGVLTQSATSGGGTGATLDYAVFAPKTVAVASPGVYTQFPPNPVSQASSSGTGLGLQLNVTSQVVSPFATGDWAFLSGIGGMTALNGQTVVLTKLSATTYQLYDVYGDSIDTTALPAYTGGGTAARIYTLPTIYGEQDLPYLKYVESADALTLCCVNQQTQTEYVAQDLKRIADDDWVFTPIVPATTVLPPAAASGAASSSGSVDYQYQITAVSPVDGTESVPSPIAEIDSAVDIASTAGTITLTWSAVIGVNEYNVYKATPGYSGAPPAGSLFGYAGSAYGTQFIDSNIVADFTQVPPQHQNPFARGQVVSIPVLAGGSGYTTATIVPNSMTGSGLVTVAVIVSGSLAAVIVKDPGMGFAASDGAGVTGDGSGAAVGFKVGAESGTYPAVPGYFQERRVFANTLNNPDTYWMSQPGAYLNYDYRIPTIPSDAVTGSPWSQEVNGIQAMIQTAGGLLVMTGLQVWLLVGQGSFATNVQAISPSSQVANQQPSVGCSATVPPIKINYDVIYVGSKQSKYFDLPYQLYALSEPIDLTENSSHLFLGHTILEHAYCEEPYKLLWAVRDDGVMLSLTYYKAQQIAGWGRHDTQGLFWSVCSVTELPVDALYLAAQRFPGSKTAYMIERMDNRIWPTVESSFCVDAGLTLPLPTPAATLTASSASGLGACTGVTDLVGGAGYSAAAHASVVDMGVDNDGKGPGTGAVPVLTIIGGVVTAVAFSPEGTGYVNPALTIVDPAGSSGGYGASAVIVLSTTATFSASAPVFSLGSVGSVIRMGGGIASVTAYTSPTQVTASILSPIVGLLPSAGGTPLPATAGNWSLAPLVSRVTGLNHLIGATVTGLADGNVITPRVVDAQGGIDLDAPASAITVGLGFQVQLQSVYLETGEPTTQGQRKKIAAVTARVENSRGILIGTNQPDGSTLSPPQLAPTWDDLQALPDKAYRPYNALAQPLFTGDSRLPVPGGFQTPGQVCAQQDLPLPMSILSWAAEIMPGDDTELKAPPTQQRR